MASQNEFNVAKRWLLDRTLQSYSASLTASHQLWGKVAAAAGDQVALQELEDTMTDYSPKASRGVIERDLLLPISVEEQVMGWEGFILASYSHLRDHPHDVNVLLSPSPYGDAIEAAQRDLKSLLLATNVDDLFRRLLEKGGHRAGDTAIDRTPSGG
jgi:hypothetical protein